MIWEPKKTNSDSNVDKEYVKKYIDLIESNNTTIIRNNKNNTTKVIDYQI